MEGRGEEGGRRQKERDFAVYWNLEVGMKTCFPGFNIHWQLSQRISFGVFFRYANYM